MSKAHASNSIDRAVFLDFDGVLFDTVKEAYCTATLASNRFQNIRDIDFKSAHFNIFNRYRFLITRAIDYYYLLEAMDKKILNKKTDIEAEFRHQSVSRPKGAALFERAYFITRRRLKNNDYGYWLSLNIPYDFLHSLAGIIRDYKYNFFIITTKDKSAVSTLLSIHNITFRKDNIYGIDSYRRFKTKGRIIRFIRNKYNITSSIFIDDSKEHLSTCSGIKGLTLTHAGWGYVSRSDSTLGRKAVLAKIKKLLGD